VPNAGVATAEMLKTSASVSLARTGKLVAALSSGIVKWSVSAKGTSLAAAKVTVTVAVSVKLPSVMV